MTPAGSPVRGAREFRVEDLRREMAVYAPPTPDEVAEGAMRVAQDEHDEAERLRVMCSTITTVTLALAAMLRDAGLTAGDAILIRREEIDRWVGSKIGISETADRDVMIRFRPRADQPIQPEEMRA